MSDLQASITTNKPERNHAREEGFTLIELLIVIVVLGILSGIVVFSLNAITGQSAQAACNSDAKSVETAVAAYESQHSGNPPQATDSSGSNANWWSSYLKSWPSSSTYYAMYTDANGNTWVVTNPTSGTTYSSSGSEYIDSTPTACNITT